MVTSPMAASPDCPLPRTYSKRKEDASTVAVALRHALPWLPLLVHTIGAIVAIALDITCSEPISWPYMWYANAMVLTTRGEQTRVPSYDRVKRVPWEAPLVSAYR